MSVVRLILRRAHTQVRLLASLAAVLAVVAGMAVLTPTLAEAGARTGAAYYLGAQPTSGRAERVETTGEISSDSAARGAEAISHLFAKNAVSVRASVRSDAVPILRGPSTAVQSGLTVVLGSETGLHDLKVLKGRLPQGRVSTPGAVDIALQAKAATTLGAHVGDHLIVGTLSSPLNLRISGIWVPASPSAGRWFADDLAPSGRQDSEIGPALVAHSDLPQVERIAGLHWAWTVTAGAGAVSPDTLGATNSSLKRITATLALHGTAAKEDLQETGALQETVARIQAANTVSEALTGVALVFIGVAAILALTQLMSLLISSRERETTLLRARGATASQFVVISIVESLLLALIATSVGASAGTVSAHLFDPAVEGLPGRALFTVAAVSASASVVMTWFVGRSTRPSHRGDGMHQTSSASATTTIVTVVLVTSAIFSGWRLNQAGFLQANDGYIDPTAALSPILNVIAGSLVAVLIFDAFGRILVRRLRGTRSVAAYSIAVHLYGHRKVFGAGVLAVSVAVGAAGFGSALGATTMQADGAATRIALGVDARVTAGGDTTVTAGTIPVTSGVLGHTDGVRAAVAVFDDHATAGQEQVSVVALAPSRAKSLLQGDAITSLITHRLDGVPLAGTPLPVGTRKLQMRIVSGAPHLATTASRGAQVGTGPPSQDQLKRTVARDGRASLVAWFMDSDGVALAVPVRTPQGGGTVTAGDPLLLGATTSAFVDLPAPAERWRLLAVQPTLSVEVPDGTVVKSSLHVDSLGAEDANGRACGTVSGGVSITLDTDHETRPYPVGEKTRATERQAVLITRPMAQELGLKVGSLLDLDLSATGSTVSGRVSAIADSVPGSNEDAAVVLDLPTLVQSAILNGESVPRARDVWVQQTPASVSSTKHRLAEDAVSAFPVPVETRTRAGASLSGIVSPAVRLLTLAAVVAAGLAAMVLASLAGRLHRSRRDEGMVLRALGETPRTYGRRRQIELALTITAGLISGCGAGMIAIALTVTRFAIASVPGAGSAVQAVPVIDVKVWLAFAILSALPCFVVSIVAGSAAASEAGQPLSVGAAR